MPKVFNRRKKDSILIPEDAVYIGRGSKFGNPFVIGVDGTRNQVCYAYEEYVKGDLKLLSAIKKELRGKDLVCYCAPLRCHGDFLLKIANED